MFKEARIKLTGWYLLIIMAISLSFSFAIYAGVNNELVRIDNAQRDRQMRFETMRNYIKQNSLPLPPDNQPYETESLESARVRIVTALGFINLAILVLSGLGGYILAGFTLEPISKMMEEQRQFVTNASHELRTPLTSLKTQIEVALRDKKMKLKDAIELIKSNLDDVNGMQKLSNYLLELSRFDRGDFSFKNEKIDLGSIVADTADGMVPVALTKGIILDKKVERAIVKGDASAVSEITKVLLDNAIKYSGKGKKIIISVSKKGEVSVRDYGIGIPAADLQHIFDRFYRADSSRSKEKIDGYGLGLSIAKSIADKVDAKIKVQSKPGKGSTFSVQFPLS